MTFAEKLKDIRTRFGLTQEKFAEIIDVSEEDIIKWENSEKLPEKSTIQELSNVFGITSDCLLDSSNQLPELSIRKSLNKGSYKNKISSYEEILKKYYSLPWEVYNLSVGKKMTKLEAVLDLFVEGDYSLIKNVSDLSPCYLVKKDKLKLLVHIKDWILEVTILPDDINEKRFTYGKNKFVNCGRLNLKK